LSQPQAVPAAEVAVEPGEPELTPDTHQTTAQTVGTLEMLISREGEVETVKLHTPSAAIPEDVTRQ
jgi:hypothetical protein